MRTCSRGGKVGILGPTRGAAGAAETVPDSARQTSWNRNVHRGRLHGCLPPGLPTAVSMLLYAGPEQPTDLLHHTLRLDRRGQI